MQPIYAHLGYISQPGVYTVVIKNVGLTAGKDILAVDTYTDELEPLKKTIWFNTVTKYDTPQAAEIRNKAIKEFFANAGADFINFKGIDAAKTVIGKKVRVLFREEEYLGYENGKPKIKTSIHYLFSKPFNFEPFPATQMHLYKRLPEPELQKFHKLLKEWEQKRSM